MKQENRDCKIVQDLLPNYIERLTDEVTNEYIEEHIAKCSECANALKAMNGDIKLEEFDQEKEINYLKGVRKRIKRTIAIVSLVVIMIAVGIVLYIHNQSKIQVNNYTFLRVQYIKKTEEIAKDGNIYGVLIAVIDENNNCKSVRIVEEGYKEDCILQQYEKLQEHESLKDVMNAKVKDNKLYYNDNYWNGNKKEELLEKWKNMYDIRQIEEI